MSTNASEKQTSPAPSQDELTIRSISPTERQDEVAALLQTVMADSSHWSGNELWQWKHVDNPFGHSLVLISESPEGRIAGLRAFMRWRFRSGEGLLNGFRPVDTATHPDFRRRGIFTKLTLQALEETRKSEAPVIFNTPNSMSVSGYLKMGWTQVGVAVPALKIRNYPRSAINLAGHAIRKRLGMAVRSEATALPVPDSVLVKNVVNDDFTDLIEQHDQCESSLIRTDRSVEYLLWRYGNNPLYDYAAIAERQAGEVTAACIVRPASGSTLKTLIFEEFLVSQPDEKSVKRLVDMAFDVFKLEAGSAYAPPGSKMREALSKAGFGRESRSRINYVCNPLETAISPPPFEFSNWSIGMSELEIL